MDPKPIYSALADRLTQDLGAAVARVTRQNLPAKTFGEAQPALVVLESGIAIQGGNKLPALWEMTAILVLHTRIDGNDAAPGEQVLDLVSRIEAALTWRQGEPRSDGLSHWTTLGGRVLWAVLEDAAIEDDLYDASQTSTVLHVKMLARG